LSVGDERKAFRALHPGTRQGCGEERTLGMMKNLTDTDPMPFGKWKNVPMQDVPASYLHYLWQNGLKNDKVSNVASYIKKNLLALSQENPDLIWN